MIEFLRAFSVTEEVMKINEDEFDYMSYVYGLTGLPDSTGQKTIDKQVLLIEPLEYKEDKVIKDFVIAIDTSGSCSGELVKRFLNKTYSILKETESFSSRVNIHIVQCDARIQNDTKITNMEEMEDFMKNMKLYGFGGTDSDLYLSMLIPLSKIRSLTISAVLSILQMDMVHTQLCLHHIRQRLHSWRITTIRLFHRGQCLYTGRMMSL